MTFPTGDHGPSRRIIEEKRSRLKPYSKLDLINDMRRKLWGCQRSVFLVYLESSNKNYHCPMHLIRGGRRPRLRRMINHCYDCARKIALNLVNNSQLSSYYLGQSKSSESNTLVPHSMFKKSFLLYRVIEKTMLYLSVIFDQP